MTSGTSEPLRLPDPVLVVLVGPSASGKSTWAAEHFSPAQVVSSDGLRAVVGEGEHDLAASDDAFAVLEQVVAARVGRSLTTVVDTLGLDAGRRRAWVDLASRHGVGCVAVVFDTPAAECRRRNAARAPRVPEPVLRGQLAAFAAQRAGLEDEGFAEVLAPRPVRVVPSSVAVGARLSPPEPAPRDVRFRTGLQLSSWNAPGGARALADRVPEVAAAAEDAGLDSLWVMDHFRQIPQVGRAWDDMLESTTTLGFLAAATRRVELGCLVHGVTYRNVGLLAKAVATLDVVSGGRAWCGIGAAWFEAEHRAYGWPFPPAAERLDLLEEALQALPLLWGKGAPSFVGERVQVPEAMAYPRPLHGRVPVLVGGSGERRTLRLVARYADACNVTGDLETVRHKVSVLHEHCRDVGRDPTEVEVTHLSSVLVAADERSLDDELRRLSPPQGAAAWRRRVVPGTVEDHRLRLRALADVGVQHAIVGLAGVWDSDAVARWGDVVTGP